MSTLPFNKRPLTGDQTLTPEKIIYMVRRDIYTDEKHRVLRVTFD